MAKCVDVSLDACRETYEAHLRKLEAEVTFAGGLDIEIVLDTSIITHLIE